MRQGIDVDRCTLCGMCRLACPEGLFEPGEKAMQFAEGAEEMCLRCGHCIAACPEDAVAIEGLSADMFPPLAKDTLGFEELQKLLLGRRSVRCFTDQPVAREQVGRIVEAVATAPAGMGGPPPPVCVISGRDKLDPMIPPMMEFYRKFSKGMKSGVGRVMMRMMMGKILFKAMDSFMPIVDRMIDYYDQTKADTITWGAPLLMLFHAPRTSISGRQDTMIACTYAMLAAHAQGLGTTMIGMVPPYLERNPAEKKRLRIPADNTVDISLIVGHPKSRFVKGIRRPVDATWI